MTQQDNGGRFLAPFDKTKDIILRLAPIAGWLAFSGVVDRMCAPSMIGSFSDASDLMQALEGALIAARKGDVE